MKKAKKLSDLQKANLVTGQLLRRCYCTPELIKLLEELSFHQLAEQVKNALYIGKCWAVQKGELEIAKAMGTYHVRDI